MTEEKFWEIVELAKKGSNGEQKNYIKIIHAELYKLTEKEIVSFDEILDELRAKAYKRELWAAAYVINGGCIVDPYIKTKKHQCKRYNPFSIKIK